MSDFNLKEDENVIDSECSEKYEEGLSQEIDPRVQVELERLNACTERINKLEIELDEARSRFRLILKDSSLRINQLAKKLGSCVEKAKPYYEARMKAKQLQIQTQKAASRYERASGAHAAAKEMVNIAEDGLKKEGSCFDPAWQEMLNHATLRVNEAESERVLSQREHQKMSSAYNETEKIIQKLHQDLKKSIIKSSLSCRRSLLQLNNLANQHQLLLLPYFEMKAEFNLLLEEQRKKVNLLEENVLKAKMSYADALRTLEEISDEIHEKRRSKNSVEECHEGISVNKTILSEDANSCNTDASTEDLYYDLRSDDVYVNLPSELKVRSSILKTTCTPLESEFSLLRRNSVPELFEVTLSNTLERNTSLRENNSNETTPLWVNCDKHEQENFRHKALGSSSISAQTDYLGKSFARSKNVLDHISKENIRDVPDYKVPDFNILRVQCEELSDSESLNSNDTADTLDDTQIECLLLDKSLQIDGDCPFP